MAKYKAKTAETKNSVADFIRALPDLQRQKDAFTLVDIMKNKSGYEPTMWGSAIIGFGSYHYVYESGFEGDAPLIGFSPRKTEFALYFASQFDNKEELLKKLGKHKAAKACIYIKKIEDIDTGILEKMITNSIKHVESVHKKTAPASPKK